MRILMFGRGVIATIYGRVLHAAGHEVEFYVRPGRAAKYGDEVRLDWGDGRRGPFGRRIKESFATTLRESLEPTDAFDLVVLSVGHHRLAEASEFLAPRIGDATVLVLGNVWDEPFAAVAPLPSEQVVFGFPLAGGGFDDDGVLQGALFASILIGTDGPSPGRRERDVFSVFASAGISVRQERDMRGWLWLHFVADAGMFAQALRSGSLARMVGDARAFREAFSTTRALLPLVEARGVDLRKHRRTTAPFRWPRVFGTLSAWATAAIPLARRSLAAHTDAHSEEALAVLEDTRREARRLGVSAPRL